MQHGAQKIIAENNCGKVTPEQLTLRSKNSTYTYQISSLESIHFSHKRNWLIALMAVLFLDGIIPTLLDVFVFDFDPFSDLGFAISGALLLLTVIFVYITIRGHYIVIPIDYSGKQLKKHIFRVNDRHRAFDLVVAARGQLPQEESNMLEDMMDDFRNS